jgi:hypothetical protein
MLDSVASIVYQARVIPCDRPALLLFAAEDSCSGVFRPDRQDRIKQGVL